MITTNQIIRIVAEATQIDRSQIIGQSRKRVYVNPRYAAMKLCREYTKDSLVSIAKEFGGRDHSTVLHAVNTMNDFIATRKSQPLESELYYHCKAIIDRMKIENRAANIFLTPHSVPTC
jgi:chromosomal replication initiation ATPase DnaA